MKTTFIKMMKLYSVMSLLILLISSSKCSAEETVIINPEADAVSQSAVVVTAEDPSKDNNTNDVAQDNKVKKIKPHWIKKSGKKYYIKSDGSYAAGVNRINGKLMMFGNGNTSTPHALLTGKKDRVIKCNDRYYYVNKKGNVIKKGWHIQFYKNSKGFKDLRLFYFKGENGESVRNKTIRDKTTDGITMEGYGVAKENLNMMSKALSMNVLNKITSKHMSPHKKLKAAFDYMTTKGGFKYVDFTPDVSKKNWMKKTAVDMLTSKGGSCSSYACAFAALAREIGYKPYVVVTRIPGRRDHAPDGYTKHKFVRINGLYYDPRGVAGGWLHADGFDMKTYPRRTKDTKYVKY